MDQRSVRRPPIELSGPYRPRPIRWLGRPELAGWKVKVYGISVAGERPHPELLDEGKAIARGVLSTLGTDPSGKGEGSGSPQESGSLSLDVGYGVAVLIVHEARDGNFVLVGWWTGENMLCQRVFHAEPESPLEFTDIGTTGIVGCVWELAVLSFERDAWVECVLAPPEPDVEAYLVRSFEADA